MNIKNFKATGSLEELTPLSKKSLSRLCAVFILLFGMAASSCQKEALTPMKFNKLGVTLPADSSAKDSTDSANCATKLSMMRSSLVTDSASTSVDSASIPSIPELDPLDAFATDLASN